MYEDAFESKFLKATDVLYAQEGYRYMQETDVSNVEYCVVHVPVTLYPCMPTNTDTCTVHRGYYTVSKRY